MFAILLQCIYYCTLVTVWCWYDDQIVHILNLLKNEILHNYEKLLLWRRQLNQ